MRVVLLLACTASFASAQGVDFDADIAPLLKDRCLACHGAEKQRGGLRLDDKKAALAGGDSGVAIRPKQSGASPLLARVASQDPADRMPPKGPPLTAEQIAKLTAWIDQGAGWPERFKADDKHWAFEPIRRIAPPAVKDVAWPRTPIDRFILAQLEKEGLAPNPEAEPATLLRRLSFDLVGLPPTPEEVAEFRPADYDAWVKKRLDAPQFGERWARHWLDVVRFAESDGFETNQPRPNAWPYRDYVIRAFNADTPYDRFIQEQLAGDVLREDAATGFLVAGPYDRVKSPDPVLTAQQRADELHDMVSTVGSAFLGLTVGCARCHTHKFDPISQIDYYGTIALLSGVKHGERPNQGSRTAIQTGQNYEKFDETQAKFIRFTIQATTGGEPCIDEFEVWSGSVIASRASRGAKATASSTLPGHAIHKVEHLNDGKYGNDFSWISNEKGKGWVQIELPAPTLIHMVTWSRDANPTPRFFDRLPTRYVLEVSLDGKTWRTVSSSAGRSGASAIYAGKMTDPVEIKRLHRGDVTQPRETVRPAVLASIGSVRSIPETATDRERRLALAGWIIDSPLSARVIVNRLWQHHFGVGLVETPSDFGKNGARPSHPELLDWLAAELIAERWSLKHIHRLIVTSAAYRQSTRAQAEGLARDAQARLLWRYPPRRLEAEAIRDAILAVSGKLSLDMGGPGFDLFEPNTNYVKVYNPRRTFGPETFRRMIYQSKWRMQIDDTFGAFDCPDGGQIAPRRSSSTTPLQALNLLNSPFMLGQSAFFADRLHREVKDDAGKVRRAFLLAFAREPTAAESQAARELIEKAGLDALCRALFNANEFVYLR